MSARVGAGRACQGALVHRVGSAYSQGSGGTCGPTAASSCADAEGAHEVEKAYVALADLERGRLTEKTGALVAATLLPRVTQTQRVDRTEALLPMLSARLEAVLTDQHPRAVAKALRAFVAPSGDARMAPLISTAHTDDRVLKLIQMLWLPQRAELMAQMEIGLGALARQLDDPACSEMAIVELRRLRVQVDLAVLQAYGWSARSVSHGFVAHRSGWRFGLREDDQQDVLERLFELNRARAGLPSASRGAVGPGQRDP